jgi:hypothetical protein
MRAEGGAAEERPRSGAAHEERRGLFIGTDITGVGWALQLSRVSSTGSASHALDWREAQRGCRLSHAPDSSEDERWRQSHRTSLRGHKDVHHVSGAHHQRLSGLPRERCVTPRLRLGGIRQMGGREQTCSRSAQGEKPGNARSLRSNMGIAGDEVLSKFSVVVLKGLLRA